MAIPNSEVAFLPPTDTGMSEIFCSILIQATPRDLAGRRPRGSVSRSVMMDLLGFVRIVDGIDEDTRDLALGALIDWYGF